MSAYSIAMKVSCDAAGCERRAVQAVYNTFNSHQGNFCTPHTKSRLADLRRSEVAAVRRVIADRGRP